VSTQPTFFDEEGCIEKLRNIARCNEIIEEDDPEDVEGMHQIIEEEVQSD
jgi:hypothetical protein